MSEKSLTIIDTRKIFMEITLELIHLVSTLRPDEWNAKTCYPTWKVKNIIVHLLQTGISRLSGQRDRFPTAERPEPVDFNTLIKVIAQSNNTWSDLFESISPRIITDMLSITEKQLADFFLSQDLMSKAYYAVTWAGEIESANWFDLAREYTERWHHQQQIREAVKAPSLTAKKYFAPVIDILIRATPYWYASVNADTGTKIMIEVTGRCGGNWVLEKSPARWLIYRDNIPDYAEKITLTDDCAWRFLTRSISREKGKKQICFSSEHRFCQKFLDVRAIMN